MTLDWVLPIHSNTSQRALLSWKISFLMVTSKFGSSLVPFRNGARKEYGLHRTGTIDAQADLRRRCDVASSRVSLPTNLSAESTVPASPQGGRSVVLADEAISLRCPRSHGA